MYPFPIYQQRTSKGVKKYSSTSSTESITKKESPVGKKRKIRQDDNTEKESKVKVPKKVKEVTTQVSKDSMIMLLTVTNDILGPLLDS